MTATSLQPEQVHQVIEKLNEIERELTRIRAMLLPAETPTPEEDSEIEKGRKEIAKGRRIPLEEVIEELG
jgi:predicted transcriptional regulator